MKIQNIKIKKYSMLQLAAGLILSTSITAQIKVDASGKVGIGITSSTTPSAPELKMHILGALGTPAGSGTTQTGVLRLEGSGSNTVLDFGCNYGVVPGFLRGGFIQATNRIDLSIDHNIVLNPMGGNVGIGGVAPARKFVVTNNDAEGTEISPFTGYTQIISYNRTTASYIPLVLQETNGGSVGIGTSSTGTFKLKVNGTTECTGNAWTSDQQFKTAIDTLQNVFEIINSLSPKSYYFDTLNIYGFNFPKEKQLGFLAQEIEQVLPELVITSTKSAEVDSAGNTLYPEVTYKSLNYIGFIPLLTKGVQQLNKTNENLESKVNALDSVNQVLQEQLSQLLDRVNSCCSIGENRTSTPNSSSTNQTDVKLTDAQSIVLEQNVPNPFAEQTSINYYLPDNTQKAQMLFYNAQGRLIQSTDLVQKGKGVVNVFASDLSNGIYTYTLVVDGKIIETKKMIKQ